MAIFQHLTHHGYDVFFDFIGIASGDFERLILEQIRARAHFLVLLTPSALERCAQNGDWLRREIETALETHRNVVPLMLEGFDFSSPSIANQLTGSLAPLRNYNALRVPVEYFEPAMERLRRTYLNVPLDSVLHPVSRTANEVAYAHQLAATSAPAVEDEELAAHQSFERGFESTDLAEQIHFLTQAIRLKPDYAEAFNNRGLARSDQGDFSGAREDYDTAIRLKPGDFEAFNNRGLLRRAQGDLAGAREDFDSALRLRPNDAEVFSNRGNLRAEQNDPTGAREDFDMAIRIQPDFAEALMNRGILRRQQGDRAGARADVDAAIRLKPGLIQLLEKII